MERRGCRQSDKPGEKDGYDKREPVNAHVLIHTRFSASVNLARVFHERFYCNCRCADTCAHHS
jgi:hypothetical protein